MNKDLNMGILTDTSLLLNNLKITDKLKESILKVVKDLDGIEYKQIMISEILDNECNYIIFLPNMTKISLIIITLNEGDYIGCNIYNKRELLFSNILTPKELYQMIMEYARENDGRRVY